MTLPDFRQRVQTHMRFVLPLPSVVRIDWRFGRKRRFVMPVVWRPMPPLYFGEPLRTTTLPTDGKGNTKRMCVCTRCLKSGKVKKA